MESDTEIFKPNVLTSPPSDHEESLQIEMKPQIEEKGCENSIILCFMTLYTLAVAIL